MNKAMGEQAAPVVVRDDGFHRESGAGDWVAVSADATPEELALVGAHGAAAVRIDVGHFADGRAFTVARRLRMMGFQGRLRARGPVLADQYAMARRAGFDEVEIPAEMAARQPEAQWRARADWQAHDYRHRLGAARGVAAG